MMRYRLDYPMRALLAVLLLLIAGRATADYSGPQMGINAAQLAPGAAASNLGFTPLAPANNLSDVGSVSTARTTLGLGALATVTPGSGVATALGDNLGVAGSIVVNGGLGGTPSSLNLTNATSLPASGINAFTAANGATGSTTIPARFSRTINIVDDFGAVGDGSTDDWTSIQKAAGMNSSGVCTYTQPTLVVIPPLNAAGSVASYRISQAIRMCSNVTLWVQSNATKILFTGDASGTDYTGATGTSTWPLNGAILGGYLPAGAANPTYATATTVAPGTNSVTLTTPTTNFIVGDMAAIETNSTYSVSEATEPTLQKLVVLTAYNSSTGVMTFEPPVDYSSSSVNVLRLTNGANTGGWPVISTSTVPVFATYNCGLVGGSWIASHSNPTAQPFMASGVFTDCVIAPDYVSAAYGVGYGNSIQNSRLSARREDINSSAMEPAYQSNNNVFDFGVVNMTGFAVGTAVPGWDFGLDEGARNNTVHIGSVIHSQQPEAKVTFVVAGTVTGGDVITGSVRTPAVSAATVNAGGSNYGNSITGTMTYNGTGCSVDPVLAVTTSSGGAIAAVNSIVIPGSCTTPISSSSTSWKPGGGLPTPAATATFNLTMTLSYSATYTDVGGDTTTTIATGVTAALNAASGFTAAGYTAVSSGPSVYVYNNTSPSLPFYWPSATVTNGGVTITTTPQYQSVLNIGNANNNKVTIDSITGNVLTGYPVRIYDNSLSGTQPLTSYNTVSVAQSNVSWAYGDAIIDNASAIGNVISDGSYSGQIFLPQAFELGYNIGSYNQFSNVKSHAPGGQPSCNQIDMSNALVNVYAPFTESAGNGFGYADMYTCRHENVTSDKVVNFLGTVAQFGPQTVTSAGNYNPGSQNTIGLEYGDVYDVWVDGSKTGTAGSVTGYVAFGGCILNYTIPATSDQIMIHARFTADTNPAVNGSLVATTDAAGTATAQSTTCSVALNWSSSAHFNLKVNAPTSPDTFILRDVFAKPIPPFYRLAQ